MGEVDNDRVIFLITSDQSTTAYLDIYHNDDIIHRTYEIVPGTSKIIVNNISPHATLEWTINGKTTKHRIPTTTSNLIFVSCDLPEGDTQRSLWNNIATESPQICCHLGDNIYGDKIHVSKNPDYDSRYHQTWNRWIDILSHTSHLMIPDDHDITDGYSVSNSFTAGDEAGLIALSKYQTSLTFNEEKGIVTKNLTQDIRLIMISRTLVHGDKIEVLKNLINTWSHHLIVVFSSAPIPMSDNLAGKLYTLVFGETGWTRPDLVRLYDLLFRHIKMTGKKVILIGGDIHIGVDGCISNGEHEIPVYITSPISNSSTIIEKIAAKGFKAPQQLDKYTLTLHAVAKRNYLTVNLPTLDGYITYGTENTLKNPCGYIDQMFHMIF